MRITFFVLVFFALGCGSSQYGNSHRIPSDKKLVLASLGSDIDMPWTKCKKGSGLACLVTQKLVEAKLESIEDGSGATEDPDLHSQLNHFLAELAERGCDKGTKPSCYTVLKKAHDGHYRGGFNVRTDLKIKASKILCVLGDVYGCLNTFSLVSGRGETSAEDQNNQNWAHGRACELDPTGQKAREYDPKFKFWTGC